ncbi:uncharacterized protein (DUF934 family) [Natronocella acetinitrilica]|uniref:Uncharacterized protein (DUF934 family) n=1 Tax=Natronocella acetinitrilica TaxID=414046 RepID=A0AAE3KCX0_9GAMM|nr:DUF934 domain-containing protein [Natronocella acetinitrilica]MCP1676191.1 uncharacterized protein (DUF934 family) [Natronocella acetinitrilica]
MPTLIKSRRLVDEGDAWRILEQDEPLPESDAIILPWDRWILEWPGLAERKPDTLGILVDGDVPIQELGPQASRVAMIALSFPTLADGRCYSHARLLRSVYGYRGELRAVGDVQHDQLSYMERVGIDSFLFAGDSSEATEALAAFDAFSAHYQNDEAPRLPRFKRRVSATTPVES